MDPLAYLNQDSLLHVNMLEGLRLGKAQLVQSSPGGVLILSGGMYMLSAQSVEAAKALCGGLVVENILIHQDLLVPWVTHDLGLSIHMRGHFAVYDGPPMLLPKDGLVVRPLGPQWLDFVRQHYTMPLGPDYMLERLESGVMVGAFMGDKAAGFAGEHDEGSMGLLEVLPEYRRHGVGRHLCAVLVNRFLAQNRVPYVAMEVDNAASHAMQRGLGFTISDKTVYYCGK